MAVKGKDLSYGKQSMLVVPSCRFDRTLRLQRLKSQHFFADYVHNKLVEGTRTGTNDRQLDQCVRRESPRMTMKVPLS